MESILDENVLQLILVFFNQVNKVNQGNMS